MGIKIKSEHEVKIKNVKKGQEKRVFDAFIESSLKYGTQKPINPFWVPTQQPVQGSGDRVPEKRTVTPDRKPNMGGSFWQGQPAAGQAGKTVNQQAMGQTPITFQPGQQMITQPIEPTSQGQGGDGYRDSQPASGSEQDGWNQGQQSIQMSGGQGKFNQGMNPVPVQGQQKASAGIENRFPGLKQEVIAEAKNYGSSMMKSGRTVVSIAYRNYVREMEGAVFGSGPKSREFRMMKPISSLGIAIVSDIGMQYKNQQVIKQLNSSNSEMLDLLSKSNKILYDNKMSVDSEFKLGSFKDFKRLRNQTDALFLKRGYGMVSNLNDKGIERLTKQLEKGNNSDLIGLLAVQKSINSNAECGLSLLRSNDHKIVKSLTRAVGRNMDESYTYQGYLKVRSTTSALRLGLTTVKYPTTMLWKAEKVAVGKTADALEFVLRKGNFNTAADIVKNVHAIGTNAVNVGESTVNTLYNAPKLISGAIKEQKLILTTELKNGMVGTGRVVGKAASNAAQQSVNYMGRTRVGRFASKVGNKKIGKKTIGNRMSGFGKVMKKGFGKYLSFQKSPFKFAQFGIGKMQAIKQAVQLLLKPIKAALMKVLGPLIAIVVLAIIILGSFTSIIAAISAVGDAVSSKAGQIKQDSSMNAAYNKLMEKEQLFSQAIQSIATSAENIPQDYSDKYGITIYTDLDVQFVDGNGSPLQETSTIKQILAMAAIYIEQDFNKYGAFMDGFLTDSIYKDYCAKLYDASHIIAVAPPDENGGGIYYCSKGLALDEDDDDLSADEFSDTKTKNPAMDDCNNKTEPLITTRQDDRDSDDYSASAWNEKLNKYKKDYSAVAYERQVRRDGDYEYIGYYTIAKAGPHGQSASLRDSSDDFDEDVDRIEEEFKQKGCENFEWIHTGHSDGGENSDGYDRYTLVCTCQECKGHLDATTYVYIGNIFDPAREEGASGSSGDAADGTETTGARKKDAYSNLEKKDAEDKYSLYAVDKYATAFDGPSNMDQAFVYCTNPDCPSYVTTDGTAPAGYVTITKDDHKCPECDTELEFPGSANPGDQASCDAADSASRYAAEKAIMDDITGKDTTIIEWWNNDGWFESLVTQKTYYRLYDENDGAFDSLKKQTASEDKNVVNKSNSTPYWFDSFTAPSKRNNRFAKHGWDSDSISQVRLLLAADWDELYGLKNFGGMNIVSTGLAGSLGSGTGMTDEQIAQLLANNTTYEELCDDRKALMATCLGFYSEIKRLGVNYHGAACTAGSLDALKNATSKNQVFTIGYPNNICTSNKAARYHCATDPGIDCSGFVSWIAAATFPGQFPKKVSTSSMVSEYVGSKLLPIDQNSLLPGDIALKKGHVLMYIGNGQWAEAAGHAEGVLYGSTHSASYFGAYGFYRFSWIDETKHTMSFQGDEDETEELEDEAAE